MFKMEANFENKSAFKMIDKIKKNLQELSNAKKEIVALLSVPVYADVIDHFKSEQGEDGDWDVWSIDYFSRMEKRGKAGNNMLQDTGRLRNNFKPTKWKRSAGGLFWFNNAKTKGGFPYAFAHNEGGDTLPKREFMWLSETAFEKVAVIAAKHFTSGIEK